MEKSMEGRRDERILTGDCLADHRKTLGASGEKLHFTFRQNARKGGDETDALYFLEAGDPGSEFGG